MSESPTIASISDKIIVLRGQRVMLDVELAALYCVKTERLNEQVKRNQERFPPQFVLRLKAGEWQRMYPQIAGTSQSRRRLDRLPLAFTEHGCLMLSNVLKSARAVEVSILIIEAFVGLRSAIRLDHDLARRIDSLSKTIHRRLGKHDRKLAMHEKAILKCLEDIRRLTHFPEPVRRQIGSLANHIK